MQPGTQSSGGGGGRNPSGAPPHGRPSPSSSASPSSSSSAVSASQLGFDSIQHQHQQLAFRQSLQHQQQQQRKFEVDEARLSYQSGNIHGTMGGQYPSSSNLINLPQQFRKLIDGGQHQNNAQVRDEMQNKGQGAEQHNQSQMQAFLQYAALQAAQHKPVGNAQPQHPNKIGISGPSGKDQDRQVNSLKIQEFMSMQAANQAQSITSRKSIEQLSHGDKQMEQNHMSGDQRTRNVQPSAPPQTTQTNMSNAGNNQFAMAQLQAMHAWALENNIDLNLPSNANLIAQLLPVWQSRMATMHRQSDGNMTSYTSHIPSSKQQIMASPPISSENTVQANVSSDPSLPKSRQILPPGPFPSSSSSSVINVSNLQAHQLRENKGESNSRPSSSMGNGMPPMQLPQSSAKVNQIDHSQVKNAFNNSETLQMQYLRQMQQSHRSSTQPNASTEGLGGSLPSHGGSVSQTSGQRLGFTKAQLHVLKAQILAFRRLKRGESSLPQEVLQAIAPPPLESSPNHILLNPGMGSQGIGNQERASGKNSEESLTTYPDTNKGLSFQNKEQNVIKEDSPFNGEDKIAGSRKMPVIMSNSSREPTQIGSVLKEEQNTVTSVKPEQEMDRGNQNMQMKGDSTIDRDKAFTVQGVPLDVQKKPTQPSTPPLSKDVGAPRKYYGPLFDFPYFTRRHDSFGSTTNASNANSLTLSYDVKDLLLKEGKEILQKKRMESMKKIGDFLAVNLERKRIKPDLVLRLQIEEKKLRLLDLQTRIRDEIDQQQQEIMAMPDRPYRKFVRLCERQRLELVRQVQLSQKTTREKQLKSIFQWRKKLLEAHWVIRDARTARNRGVAKYHERMLREFSKRKDEDRNKRMEALKNNDVDRYREMLLEQQTSVPGDAAQRYAVLSSFLSQTEDYLHKLGGKIAAAKSHQEVEEAANAAAAAARTQGLSEEEVRAAAACAGEEVMIRKRFSEMNAPRDRSSVNKYYHLAHAINERVVRQPSMLRTGTLRDYQLVGLQWMLSLYNNKLNGILADEMGLGKTVQVMALIAYLMEFKGNYGPHLIIVPNAVLVNWKSELYNWLPSASCIFYVGGKEQRSRLFSQEVCAMKFNILVTTYEFVMYDRTKLSKIDWKYIIIDEAQRMKDRESVLARDLDRYRCQRRLLLTGTPLQNDLKELWSLLNLLLPEVFDNRKAFHDWFSQPFQKDGPSHNAEDDWLETEKKVIIIHRLHQILEPFMLRRRVEDVEGSLPPKVSIVLKCRMSGIQGAIYDWIKATGTLRVDPEDELRRVEKNPNYQMKMYKNLNNRCMELRKACNHPLLNYPYYSDLSQDFVVKSCGKLWVLDRILIKLQRTGHRVLLFSTMTKLLDILEEYLQWRRLVYRRIDGTTSLEDRESAIVDFNGPDSDCFIFLLSIRAAGRGLNLQTADTVVIYDPDPNPKNEEQAVARAHRIGQTREVKVIYMEAVVDKISSHEKEDELRTGGTIDSDDDLAGKDRYIGSIESLIRNNIQQYKIDMADEVINAGRFDQRTTHEERRLTLETLLHDEERYQETVHDVPSLHEVNRMIARSEEEVDLFDQMDEEFDWTGEMVKYDQVPEWLRAGSKEVNAVIASLSKKPLKNTLVSRIEVESGEVNLEMSPNKTERRGRPRGSSSFSIYKELDDEIGEDSDASSEDLNDEEDGEIGEFEDDFDGVVGLRQRDRDNFEEDEPVCDSSNYEFLQTFNQTGSPGSSSGSRRLVQSATPSVSSQKFGSLSALDARPGSFSKRMSDDLEEGEIAASGDSHMDCQQSGSWIHDRDDAEDEQVLQPRIKRKRSIRIRPRYTTEKIEEKTSNEKSYSQRVNCSYDPPRSDLDYEPINRVNLERHESSDSVLKRKRNLQSTKTATSLKLNIKSKPAKLNGLSKSEDDGDQSRESWDMNTKVTSGSNSFAPKMSDIIQRKCKNVISKLQRRIDRDGHQIVPILTEFWRRNENSSYLSGMASVNTFDLKKIDQRIERLEYNTVDNFIEDVQLVLRNVAQYHGYSYEVRVEARKIQDLFFDIMKIAFPDSDFREARSTPLFSSSVAPSLSTPSFKQATAQSKRYKNEINLDTAPTKTSYKETKITSTGVRIPSQQVEKPLLTHPGDLVICKKKRKDRDKSVAKVRLSGPVSPPAETRNIRTPIHKEVKMSKLASPPQQLTHQSPSSTVPSSGVEEAQWAKPVKRMRTDTGKRRMGHI